MSYPDTIHARDLRPGDRVYDGHGTERRILATCWKPGWSFIKFLVEGFEQAASLPIGHVMYVRREA